MNQENHDAKAVGRPRDEAVGGTILQAARALVREHGYEGVTTAMIAAQAGVSKQTIYRRWPSKADLVLDAFLDHARASVDQPAQRDASVRVQLAEFLDRTFAALEESGPAVRSLMASAQRHGEFRQAFKTRFIEPRRSALTLVLLSGLERGEIPPDADLEAAVIALYGAVWYRLLLDEPLDLTFGRRLADTVLNGLAGHV
ncbi:TetR/AcrR family transcriptional regulator [Methylovirgula sp. 4M-Z18]|uniref:TetR/AcrR family transcriptional regulator n=1 Tax=Methylovirgula sp. 4M-Z18 TaxID=2293567 RepID=UPI000E2F13A2|nr:TetR/AcrR family transcriptional regulator [Methylovirgula sp. 4M-Z18]RFB79365.1 TetR/AcrR family transcriptional regulator [Methylovirgula sp. 4M-Z18]